MSTVSPPLVQPLSVREGGACGGSSVLGIDARADPGGVTGRERNVQDGVVALVVDHSASPKPGRRCADDCGARMRAHNGLQFDWLMWFSQCHRRAGGRSAPIGRIHPGCHTYVL